LDKVRVDFSTSAVFWARKDLRSSTLASRRPPLWARAAWTSASTLHFSSAAAMP
jgi:hypothetical protein